MPPWVSYKLAGSAPGGVPATSSARRLEWFAELYAAYFMEKMKSKHRRQWLAKLKAEAN